MIHMYLENNCFAQFLTLRNTDCWYMLCDFNDNEDICIYLNMLGNEYEICCSTELTQGRPKLDSYTVIDYYNAVVRAVYQQIQTEGGNAIDMEAIKARILPDFWREWKCAGFVDEDFPIRREVNFDA